MSEKRIVILGCGGAGINAAIRAQLFAEELVDVEDAPEVDVFLADSSRSNLKRAKEGTGTFLLPDVDGSGKVRRSNYDAISNTVSTILTEQEPGDLNVVIFSAAGGTGSVLGPLLVKALLEEGHPTVCLVIGSHDSLISSDNTFKTVQSLEGVSQAVDTPVVMSYFNNLTAKDRAQIDSSVDATVRVLTGLMYSSIDELDSSDIANWLGFNAVSDVEAQLALLEFSTDLEVLSEIEYPVSMLSLIRAGEEDVGVYGPDYHTTGYLTGDNHLQDAVHFSIEVNGVEELMKVLEARKTELQKNKAKRPKRSRISNAGSGDGMVL